MAHSPFSGRWARLKDIPEPRRFFFLGTKRKRDVEVKVFICPGFTHAYADLEEDEDVVWDAEEKEWKRVQNELSDDKAVVAFYRKIRGRRLHERFERRIQAEEWVLEQAKRLFPKATHRLVTQVGRKPWRPSHIGKTDAQLATKCVKCKLAVRDRGENITGDWTGSPYCDICAARSPRYGDYEALRLWKKVTAKTARGWTK